MCLIGGVAADAVPVFFRPIYCCQLQPWPNILSLGVTTISMLWQHKNMAGLKIMLLVYRRWKLEDYFNPIQPTPKLIRINMK